MRLFGKFNRRLKDTAWTFLFLLVSMNVVLKISIFRAKQALLEESIAAGGRTLLENNADVPKKDDLMYWNPYLSIDSLQGNQIRSSSSSKSEVANWIRSWPHCASYFTACLMKRMVHPYYFGQCDMNSVRMNKMSITLAVQMDMSETYWEKLKWTVNHWNGPISIGLHVLKDEEKAEEISFKEILHNQFKKFDLMKAFICVHLLIESVPKNKTYYYPVNSLRNVATKYISTKYVLYLEADFIPMPGLAEHIQTQITKWNTTHKAFVIPAYYSTSRISDFPRTKSELIKQWNNNVIIPWWYNKHWKQGHMATKYDKIPNATSIYEVEYKNWYEPYYVIEKKNSPYYPEEILFGRKDKLIHTTLMHRMGYQFFVLPDTYIVHTPHESSNHTVLSQDQLICADRAYVSLDNKIKALNSRTLNTYIQPRNGGGQEELYEYKKVESLDKNKPGVLLLFKRKVKPKVKTKSIQTKDKANKPNFADVKAGLKKQLPVNWWAYG